MTAALDPGSLAALRDLLATRRRVAITTHHDPDGDALGGSLGLASVLEKLGHVVDVVLPNTPPEFLQWLPGYDRAMAHDRAPDRCVAALQAAEVVFALDFNRPDRVRALEKHLLAAPRIVLIDHHQQPEDFAHIPFSDPGACATSQLIFDILAALGHEDKIDGDAAVDLYAGIMTDTGSFRFNSTTAHTLRVAAKLVDRGVKVDEVYVRIMDDYSEHRLRLLGFALSERMEVMKPLSTVIFHLDRTDLDRFHYKAGDTEGLVNHGLSIRGIRLSVLLMERNDGVKLSLRSTGALPVDRLAREHFGGGGHTNAAGGKSSEGMDATIERLKHLLPGFLAQHPG